MTTGTPGILAFMSHPARSRVAPFALFMAFIALGPALGEWCTHAGFDPRLVYILRTVAVAAALLVFWKDYHELRMPGALSWQETLEAVGCGVFVFVLWINLDFSWATLGEPAGFDPSRADGTGPDWTLVLFRMAGLALLVPVMEELFWRSFLMRWIDRPDFLQLDPRTASMRALLVSSLLFASEHHLWLAGLLAGLVYGRLYVRTRNLWAPVIGHATTNGMLGIWILATGNWQFW